MRDWLHPRGVTWKRGLTVATLVVGLAFPLAAQSAERVVLGEEFTSTG